MYDVSSTNDTSTVNSNTIDIDSLESESTNEDDDSQQSESFDEKGSDDFRISHRVFELMDAVEDDYTTGYMITMKIVIQIRTKVLNLL